MAQNPVAVDELPIAANLAATDMVLVIYNANGVNANATLRQIMLANLCANVIISNSAPANSASVGNAGNFAYDSGYIYMCTSSNTWMRAALSTF
jgi:hypothetical protein